MLALLALIALPRQDEPPRLRTILENGSVVLVEPMKSKTVSVQLFASARYVPETESTHGFRHLIEHLVARGMDGELDRRLESNGCFLTARTLRDAMQIEVRVGPEQVSLGLDAIGTVLRKPIFTQAQIDKEVRVMRDEFAMQDPSARLSSASWLGAYGEAGLDPVGTFDSVYRATPEKLDDLFRRQFATEGLVLVIVGPVDLDRTTNMAKALLGNRSRQSFKASQMKREGTSGRVASDGFGESRAAIVPGFNSPAAMGALAAALATASELENCFVTYTPSARNGLVILGRTDRNSGVGLFVDGLSNPAALFKSGKSLARQWVMRQLQTPSGNAYLRGLLLAQGAAYRPEMMLEQIESLTPAQFEAGFDLFRSEKAVTAVGTR